MLHVRSPSLHGAAATGFDEASWLDPATSSSSMRVSWTLEALSEMEVLADADMLVASFTSNMAKLVALLRGARGKARASAVKVDLDWAPS